jgi:hypothetical protein
VTRKRAQGIDALEFGAEGKTRQPQVMDQLGLARGQTARNPGEPPGPVGQGAAHFGAIEAAQDGGDLLDDLIEIENELWVGIERMTGNVGGEQLAVPIDNVGPRPALADRLGNVEMDVDLRAQSEP